ncbi:MAG: hypothetical protein GPOALKHO_000433 [Sodalis sp.]|uniref:hypothetical protein n=1 Tax=Sodalis sp. (in: enterobacteria) TaxID=1898979 RepID=UPI003872BDA8|nr:MAG: hypothetical protein GPOALKHO_000433 [Sodalis sp.]
MSAHGCTLFIIPLLQQLICIWSERPGGLCAGFANGRLVIVMLEQFGNMPMENLPLPFSSHPRIRHITDTLNQSPGEHRTPPE